MDPALISLIPTGGVAGVLVVVIIYLLRQNSGDRQQYREHITTQAEEHAAEIKALEGRQVKQLEQVEEQLRSLRAELATALTMLEAERGKRWSAEDKAAQYRRELASLRGQTHE